MKDYSITTVTDELKVLNEARNNLMIMTGCWIDIRFSAEKPKLDHEAYSHDVIEWPEVNFDNRNAPPPTRNTVRKRPRPDEEPQL